MKHGITGRNYVGAVALTVGFSLLLSGCAAAPPPKPMQAAPPPVAAAPPPSPAAVAIPPGFDVWLGQLRTDAVARGISKATVDAALTGLAPLPRVLELDRQQPEYSQTFWRYLDSAVSPKRISDGQAALQQHAALLRKIEQQYGVPARFLVAFWGLETNYGKGIGGFPTIAALATLAYDGRRSEFFRGELFNALTIVDRGHIAPAEMIGSWAGAMGQTQFMPSTFLRYGVDADQDGRIDIWRDIPDALTSAANYLKSLGWDGQHTWGREVTLPASFDVGLASLDTNATDTVKTLREWSALGLRQSDGALLPQQDLRASLVLPGGRLGPAFLVYDNYRAVLKWNRSMFYAVAVGYLADRLTGGAPLAASHRNEEPLRREEVMSLQEGLHRLGHLSAEPDGVLGGSTRQAVRAFQRAHQIPPDGYASRELVATVARESGVSPPAKPAA